MEQKLTTNRKSLTESWLTVPDLQTVKIAKFENVVTAWSGGTGCHFAFWFFNPDQKINTFLTNQKPRCQT